MKRSMMQAYVEGSKGALDFYQSAFDAIVMECHIEDDGTILHAELDLGGAILALSERRPREGDSGDTVVGNGMQFCLHYDRDDEASIRRTYEALQPGATVLSPLAPCDYSPLMADVVDRYGIRWCLFV